MSKMFIYFTFFLTCSTMSAGISDLYNKAKWFIRDTFVAHTSNSTEELLTDAKYKGTPSGAHYRRILDHGLNDLKHESCFSVNTSMVKECLEKEKELSSNNMVFYHARPGYSLFFDELNKHLENQSNTNFVFIRAPKTTPETAKDLYGFLSRWPQCLKNIPGNIFSWFSKKTDLSTISPKDDTDPEFSKRFLSTNLSLHGNRSNPGESSLYYYEWALDHKMEFKGGGNANIQQHLATDIIDSTKAYGYQPKYGRQLAECFKQFADRGIGTNMLQIFVPVDKATTIAYASYSYGTPVLQPVQDGSISPERHQSSMREIYKQYAKDSSKKIVLESVDVEADHLQARVLVGPLLDPKDTKIFKYVKHDHEAIKDMQSQVAAIMHNAKKYKETKQKYAALVAAKKNLFNEFSFC
jgi:hypothetical protein